MKDIKRIFVLASLFLPFLSAGLFGAQEIAIKAGTILPISDAPIENGTILIKDGKIAELGRNVALGADARVIDASGKFVMPGLIDAQSRLFVIDSELNESRLIAPDLNLQECTEGRRQSGPGIGWATRCNRHLNGGDLCSSARNEPRRSAESHHNHAG